MPHPLNHLLVFLGAGRTMRKSGGVLAWVRVLGVGIPSIVNPCFLQPGSYCRELETGGAVSHRTVRLWF